MDFKENGMIKKVIASGFSNERHEKYLHVAYGVDRRFLFGAGISITSILLNNEMKISFHVFTDYEDDDFNRKINSLVEEYQTSITIYILDSEALRKLPHTKAWSYATYFRFVAFEYLFEKTNAVLYLDADIVCKGSLQEIRDLNVGENYAAVVPDVDFMQNSNLERLNAGILCGEYFNAGVIYANLNAWKREGFMAKAIEMLSDGNNNFSFLDQDVLNILFHNKVLFLNRKFNCIYSIKQELKYRDFNKYKETIKNSTSLIHYTGVTKPWHLWAKYPSSCFFYQAYKASPWKDTPLIEAETAKQFKKKSRHERLQGKYIKSIISYCNYIIIKIKE